jgi:hypothetical protein
MSKMYYRPNIFNSLLWEPYQCLEVCNCVQLHVNFQQTNFQTFANQVWHVIICTVIDLVIRDNCGIYSLEVGLLLLYFRNFGILKSKQKSWIKHFEGDSVVLQTCYNSFMVKLAISTKDACFKLYQHEWLCIVLWFLISLKMYQYLSLASFVLGPEDLVVKKRNFLPSLLL